MASFAFYQPVIISKIISGGQTGADRAALDWAIANNIQYGGWCPKGRLAEDGVIDPKYNLQETPESKYIQRTEWNVRDSDATIIFSTSPKLSGGSLATAEIAMSLNKPYLFLSGINSNIENPAFLLFLKENDVNVLNVAGPRKSGDQRIGDLVFNTLNHLVDKPVNPCE